MPEVPSHSYQTALTTVFSSLFEVLIKGNEEDVLTREKVRWWSDFNRIFYHPRSSIQLNQYQLDLSPFDSFDQGSELFHDVDKVPNIHILFF